MFEQFKLSYRLGNPRMKHAMTLLAAAVLCSFAMSASAANRSDPDFVPTNTGPAPLGGGSCATPVTIGSLPFSQAGNTCGGTNNITNYGGPCGTALPFPYPGPEDVWAITVGAGNAITVSADLTGSTGDLALYLLSTCGNGSSCLFASQDAIGPGAGPEDMNGGAALTGLTAGSTYYIYVDSYYGSGGAECGTYTLNVGGTLPVSLESYSID
ncbi:MAG: hypothetical protein E6Q99_03550 [Elusimicrobia bacterium]|nr:MAG: hypothetical protein E6Q99_03550 [Elusimicrobiota bacterium]